MKIFIWSLVIIGVIVALYFFLRKSERVEQKETEETPINTTLQEEALTHTLGEGANLNSEQARRNNTRNGRR